jgi:mRNA interferase RelE/StbE
MQYKINYSKTALKGLKEIDFAYQKLITSKIKILSENMASLSNNITQLKGEENLFRLRVADYRVIFQKNEETITILIVRIGHRKEVYL